MRNGFRRLASNKKTFFPRSVRPRSSLGLFLIRICVKEGSWTPKHGVFLLSNQFKPIKHIHKTPFCCLLLLVEDLADSFNRPLPNGWRTSLAPPKKTSYPYGYVSNKVAQPKMEDFLWFALEYSHTHTHLYGYVFFLSWNHLQGEKGAICPG